MDWKEKSERKRELLAEPGWVAARPDEDVPELDDLEKAAEIKRLATLDELCGVLWQAGDDSWYQGEVLANEGGQTKYWNDEWVGWIPVVTSESAKWDFWWVHVSQIEAYGPQGA